MEHTSPHIERRKHPRFNVQNLVVAVPNKPQMQVARIVNISKSGMAVRYVDQEDWLGTARQVDIFVNSDFFMTGIPVENIQDFSVSSKSLFNITSERQCCLQFGSLTRVQEKLLDEFILEHTGGTS